MIVLDASAMAEALVGTAPDPALLDAMSGSIHAPTLLDVEIHSVIRGLTLGRVMSERRAEQALAMYWGFSITRHAFEPLAARIWSLRHQFTAYDANYIALAEALDAPLFTCDQKLPSAIHGADVRVMPRSS